MDVRSIRQQFPALSLELDGRPVIFADGPGGTQAHRTAISAIAAAFEAGLSNHGGPYLTSEAGERIVAEARAAMADLYNASPAEIVFGQNMTSLTFAVSRAIASTWSKGDEVVLTRLDHDANITPWVRAATERGVAVRWVEMRDYGLDPADVAAEISDRTRLVAVTAASNALGTLVDVAAAADAAHEVDALVFVDAVQYAPHGAIDVQAWDADFLVASAYKFFGPHTGILFGRRELLAELPAYKVRPAPDTGPGRWETGTQSFESLAGVTAAVDYLASHGHGPNRRSQLVGGFGAIGAHEQSLTERFLAGVAELPGVRLHGVEGDGRTPTFAIDVAGRSARESAVELGRRGIFVSHGHYYAVEVMRSLGVLESGGLIRLGFVHYNTADEVDRVLEELGRLT